jgi:prepilin-type processing-associated H-X9-DG protein
LPTVRVQRNLGLARIRTVKVRTSMRRLVAAGLACVLAILLVGLSLPLILRWRDSAERVRCMDHLRRLGSVFANKGTPAGTVVGSAARPESRLSWFVIELPWLGHSDVANWIDQTAPWAADANSRAGKTFLPILNCPALTTGPATDNYQPYNYPGIAGVGRDAAQLPYDHPRAGAFRYDAPTPPDAFRDGFANCMVMLESGVPPNFWIAGGPPTVRSLDPATRPYLGIGRPFGGGHRGGANAAFADGSVRFLTDHISPEVLELLAGIADGS